MRIFFHGKEKIRTNFVEVLLALFRGSHAHFLVFRSIFFCSTVFLYTGQWFKIPIQFLVYQAFRKLMFLIYAGKF